MKYVTSFMYYQPNMLQALDIVQLNMLQAICIVQLNRLQAIGIRSTYEL